MQRDTAHTPDSLIYTKAAQHVFTILLDYNPPRHNKAQLLPNINPLDGYHVDRRRFTDIQFIVETIP